MRTVQISKISFVLIALLAAAPLAKASEEGSIDNPWEVNLSIGPFNQHVGDASFDLVSGNDWMPMLLISLEFELLDDWFITPSYFYGSSGAKLHKKDDAKLTLEGWELRVRKGFQLLSWLRPYAAAAVSYNWFSIDIERDSGSTLSQEDEFFAGRVGARGGLGAEFMIPRSVMSETSIGEWLGDFTLGLAVEAGYSYRQTFGMDQLAPSAPSGAASGVPLATVDVGTLDVSGWYWTLDFRFLF